MINWRQLYKESQTIKPDDLNLSTERISRLVNIYKNDLIEQDLHRYASRLLKFSRTCQICTPKSYTTYKWLDTLISGEKNLFDFHLSGRSVSALVYYWNKRLFTGNDKRGQITDFEEKNDHLSISNLATVDENIIIGKHLITSIICRWIMRFQMYYTYRKAQILTPLIDVHLQPMKTFRSLFQTKICPIFVCFINEENTLPQLFWTFRHLITIFNWPLTTKIFSTHSYPTKPVFERWMMHSLGFVDFSSFNTNRIELVRFLYRCLKTCQENGPLIFLFDHSTIFKPTNADYFLMSFLCDLIRLDLSIPDVTIIPSCLYKTNLSFSQPFGLKESMEFFLKKFSIQTQLGNLWKADEDQLVCRQVIDCLFQHLGYNAKPPVSMTIEFPHIITAMELCQIDPPSTVEAIHSTLQNLLKTCSFIIMDNHQWNEITEEDIRKYQNQFKNTQSKYSLLTVLQKEYFLDILAALTILSITKSTGNISRVFEIDFFDQLKFFFFLFDDQQYLTLRPCQNLSHLIQYCQWRNYIPLDYIPQKSMAYRETILSDHEWSDEEENDMGIEVEFLDQDDNDDEVYVDDLSNEISDTNKCAYRINYHDNLCQLQFFTSLVGPLIEAIVWILKFHIDKQLTFFTLEGLQSNQEFAFRGTSFCITDETLSIIHRAYLYRSMDFFSVSDEIPKSMKAMDERISPLSMQRLVSLQKEFFQLFTCFDLKKD